MNKARRMLEMVSKHNIKVETIHFEGLKEIPKAVELIHSGKIKGKAIILIDEEAIAKEKEGGIC